MRLIFAGAIVTTCALTFESAVALPKCGFGYWPIGAQCEAKNGAVCTSTGNNTGNGISMNCERPPKRQLAGSTKAASTSGAASKSGSASRNVPDQNITAFAYSGIRIKTTHLHAVEPDCSTMQVNLKLTSPPSHGRVELVKETGFAAFPQSSKFMKCNDKPVAGTSIYYTANETYAGDDRFVIEAITATGYRRKTVVKIEVAAGAVRSPSTMASGSTAQPVVIPVPQPKAVPAGSTVGQANIKTHDAYFVGGRKTKFWRWMNLHPDCTSAGDSVVRVVEPPAVGQISVEIGQDFSAFPATDVRHSCNAQRAPASMLYYEPPSGFTGTTTALVETISPTGGYSVMRFNFIVK